MSFEGGAEIPLQGHLSLTGDPTEMRVMWVSGTSKLSMDSSGILGGGVFKVFPW